MVSRVSLVRQEIKDLKVPLVSLVQAARPDRMDSLGTEGSQGLLARRVVLAPRDQLGPWGRQEIQEQLETREPMDNLGLQVLRVNLDKLVVLVSRVLLVSPEPLASQVPRDQQAARETEARLGPLGSPEPLDKQDPSVNQALQALLETKVPRDSQGLQGNKAPLGRQDLPGLQALREEKEI